MSTISASTTSTTAYKVTADTTGTLVLQTGSGPTTAVTIDTSQRVGIGTSSPTTTLTLSQAAARLKAISTSDNGSWSEWASNNGSGNVFYSGIDNSTGASFGVPYAGVMYHGGAYPLVFANNATERGRFDTGGRFLVGLNTAVTSWGSGAAQQIQATASGASYPGYSAYAFSASAGSAGMINLGHSRSATVGTLSTTQSGDVLGYLVFEGVNSSNALAGGGYISITQTGAAGATYIPGALQFYTSDASVGATEKARIDSSGRLLVGYTSIPSAPPSGTVGAVGYSTKKGTGNGLNASGNVFNISWADGLTGAHLWVDTSDLGQITVSSDYRIKKNIESQTAPAIDRLMQLRSVKYELADYGTLFKADGVQREGFIAHELQEIIPSAVDGEKDAENQIQSLRLDALCSVMVKAIQEQQAIIETLTNRITALEAK